MIISAHAAAGAFIGAAIKPESKKAWAGTIVLALGSHALLDFVPHWHYPFIPLWLALDIIAALVIVFLIIKITRIKNGSDKAVVIAALVAAGADIEYVLVEFSLLLPEPVFLSHRPGFPHLHAGFFWGNITQFMVVVISLAGSYYLSRN